MNIPLQRLIEGIIATMRSDVIPHVSDSYARGQAVGVIDLLNNIAPRVEWAHAPLKKLVETKHAVLDDIRSLIPGVPIPEMDTDLTTAEDILALKARLDAAIGDAVSVVWPRRREAEYARAALALSTHLHDEMAAEMKITRKPLFAEIASGGGGKT